MMGKTEYLSVCPKCSRINENCGGGWRLLGHLDKWLVKLARQRQVPDIELMEDEICIYCEEVSDEH